MLSMTRRALSTLSRNLIGRLAAPLAPSGSGKRSSWATGRLRKATRVSLGVEHLEDRVNPSFTLTNLATSGFYQLAPQIGLTSGVVAGTNASLQGFEYNGALQNIPLMEVGGISADGSIIVGVDSAGHAALYENGKVQTLNIQGIVEGITISNNGSYVAGWGLAGYGQFEFSFVEHNGMVTILPGLSGVGNNTYVTGVNDSGMVIGNATIGSTSLSHAFEFNSVTDHMLDLGSLGGHFGGSTNTLAYAINDAGQIVGGSLSISGVMNAFLYQNGRMVDLNATSDISGFVLEAVATGINDNGVVVGTNSLVTATGVRNQLFEYSAGTMVDVTASLPKGVRNDSFYSASVDDFGDIVAISYNGTTYHNVLFTNHPTIS